MRCNSLRQKKKATVVFCFFLRHPLLLLGAAHPYFSHLCDCCLALSYFSFPRCTVSSETLDVTRSLLWGANCMEPEVLCGCWLSDAASERRGGGGGESRQHTLLSVMSLCVTIALLIRSASSLFLSDNFNCLAPAFRAHPHSYFLRYAFS